jgi:hypothetical protein
MCDFDEKFYVMDRNNEMSGPYDKAEARDKCDDWNGRRVYGAPHRVVTIVATEVPEPPKVSRVVTRSKVLTPKPDQYRFHGKDLQVLSGESGWCQSMYTPADLLSIAAGFSDYAFVRDFAALCEEVLGGGK